MAERRVSVSSSCGAFDRFIPFRPNLDVDSSNARLMSCSPSPPMNDSSQFKSPATKSYNRLLSDLTPDKHGNILPIRCRSPTSPFSERLNYLLPSSPDEGYYSPTAHIHRRIPTSPECIMDMPGLRDDFYTNILDWSDQNLIAVALHQSTYIWNADSKECQKIESSSPVPSDFYVSALCWGPREQSLAIAVNEGKIQVWDVEKMTSSKIGMFQERCPVGALQWTEYGIISGNKKGDVTVFDTRIRRSMTRQLSGHSKRDICGLCMAPRRACLASGSDDGTVNIWDLRMMKRCNSILAHQAGVKALAWCPWRQEVLATGGGTSDGHIRLWYAQSGEKLGEAVTKSQVCGIVWSEEYKEMVSAVGSPTPDKNDLIVWNMKNREFQPVAKLRQHMARPLHIAISPDKSTIASAGADESLCLWRTFPQKSRGRGWTKWDRSPLNPTNKIR